MIKHWPINFTNQLLRNHGVRDATYLQVILFLGDKLVMGLTSPIGHFVMLYQVMNVVRTPALPAREPLAFEPLLTFAA